MKNMEKIKMTNLDESKVYFFDNNDSAPYIDSAFDINSASDIRRT